MTRSSSVKVALRALPTYRIQRLVDRLEHNPDTNVTACGWLPQCPMTLAGYPPNSLWSGPEQRFAVAWDRFAVREHQRWWHKMVKTPHQARRCDVQALLRMANELLAQRAAAQFAVAPASTVAPAHPNQPPPHRVVGREFGS